MVFQRKKKLNKQYRLCFETFWKELINICSASVHDSSSLIRGCLCEFIYTMYVYRTLTKPDFFDLVLYFQVTGGVLPFLSTMATQRVLPQSKETLLQSYNKRLKDDIKSILENFTEIIKTAKVCRANALPTAIVFFKLCCVRYFIILRSVLPNYRVFIYDWKQEEQCAPSADRGRDTGFPTNPSRTGPLWDAR